MLQDSSRGPTAYNYSNADANENTDTNNDWFRSFDDDGFTVSATRASDGAVTGEWNQSGRTYVGWSWKANGNTTVTNESGSITSTVQANTDAGFSIVTYTGTGSTATVGHGLSQTPDMVITKSRNATQYWIVQHVGLSAVTENLYLQLTNSEQPDSQYTALSPTTLTVNGGSVNASTTTYVSYCFQSC